MGLHKMPTVKLFDILGVITKINTENFIETARICGAIAVQILIFIQTHPVRKLIKQKISANKLNLIHLQI